MKLWDIVKKIGGGVLASSGPAGALVMGAINAALPEDEQLPANATGADVQSIIEKMPAADRARLMEKELEVDITQIKESNSTLRAALDADTKNPHTTRPYIAKQSFHVIAFTTVITISLWAYGVIKGDEKMVTAVMDGWKFVLAVIGPLVTLLWAYFGVLKQEHKNRLDAANGVANPPGILGAITGLLKRK